MKPMIGVIGRPDMASDDDKVICIWEGTRRAIVKKGGIPFLILPTQDVEYDSLKPKDTPKLTEEEKNELKRLVDMCDGLLLPGGYKWYEFDEFIYNYALEKNMPILGICAGMQMMCRIDQNKNNICKDTTVRNDTTINHHQRDKKYVHNVSIIDNTILSKIIDEKEIKVNSKHNYHVSSTTNLKVSAYSEDGLIEAVEYDDKDFVIGVQWHPETMLDYDENANKILDEFINKCRK
jgi:glutamine amidotransferase class-I domain protein